MRYARSLKSGVGPRSRKRAICLRPAGAPAYKVTTSTLSLFVGPKACTLKFFIYGKVRMPFRRPSMYRRKPRMLRRKARAIYRRKPRVARFAASKPRYFRNRRYARQISKFSESKLLALTPVEEQAPVAIQVGAIAYYWAGCLNVQPTGWGFSAPAAPGQLLQNLGGIQLARGVTAQERVGDYVYYKKTHAVIQVDMNATSALQDPIEFRFIIAKSRGLANPAMTGYIPSSSLFLNSLGNAIGHFTGGVTGTDLMLQPLNKRDWVIFRDQKFTLTAPQIVNGGGFNGKYPSRKNLIVNLKHYAKAKISNTNNQPKNLDTTYVMYLYASAIGKDRDANVWEVSLRGTTSYVDN